MANFKIGAGLDSYLRALEENAKRMPGTCGNAVYKGAKIVADAIKENINALPVEKAQRWTADNMATGVTAVQKQGLIDGFGISKMQNDNGFYNVKAGFHGYNKQYQHEYGGYQANVLIARSVESGTYFRKKHPFVKPAIFKSRKKAEEAMKEHIEKKLIERYGGK